MTTVTRDIDTNINDILPTPLYQVGNPLTDDMLTPTNSLLFGSISRTSMSNGKTATVNGGENIQVAIDAIYKAGGGEVILLPGTYILKENLSIPSGVIVKGSSRDNVLIDCNQDYSVNIVGELIYSTGTVTIAVGETTVVGSGTTWTSDMVDKYILLDDSYYKITAFNSTTSLTIEYGLTGESVSGGSYVIVTPNFNPTLSSVTIFNSTVAGVKVQYVIEPILDNIIVYSCGIGFDIDDTLYVKLITGASDNVINVSANRMFGFKIDFSSFESATSGDGITLTDCGNATVIDSLFSGNSDNGISLTNCRKIAFMSLTMASNGNNGVEFVSGNRDMQFIGVSIDGNTNDGIRLTDSTDRIAMSTSTITNSGGYGINILSSTCDNNNITTISFNNNTLGNIIDNGTDTNYVGADSVLTTPTSLVANLPTVQTSQGYNSPTAYE